METNYFPGDVITVDLGDVSQVKGHEQAKKRPCVVLKSFPRQRLVIVVPVTSTDRPAYTSVKISQGQGGLKNDSHALCTQIRSISFDRITGVLGQLNNLDLTKIKTVLSDILEL